MTDVPPPDGPQPDIDPTTPPERPPVDPGHAEPTTPDIDPGGAPPELPPVGPDGATMA